MGYDIVSLVPVFCEVLLGESDVEGGLAFPDRLERRALDYSLDSLRQMDWASRDLRKRQKQVDAATQDLSIKLGRAPSENEMAAELGVSLDRCREVMMQLRTVGLVAPNPAAATGPAAVPEEWVVRKASADNRPRRKQIPSTHLPDVRAP